MREPQNKNRKFELINKLFLVLNATMIVFLLISSIVFFNNTCLAYTFQIYELLYIFQTIQHYLIYKFPTIDINKHHVAYRRLVIVICLVDLAYLLMCITFWQKTQLHPVYCVLCVEIGLGAWIGLLLIPH